jgi:N,N'-diacetyllegionaminate synthase
MKSIEIIAEIGVNHNGDLTLAKKLVDEAVGAGVDTVKFQTFFAEQLTTNDAPRARYQKIESETDDLQRGMLKALELEPVSWIKLRDYVKENNLNFLSTAYDEKSIEFLVELGQRRFKIPSGEINNVPYLRKVGAFGYPIVLSTGMATMGEIETALEILESAGSSHEDIVVLHCTSEYPASFEEINLRAMGAIREEFDVKVGYSDHTLGIEVPIAAAALGAVVIEKHFTLDRSLHGPDHKASLDPVGLKEMVKAIRNIELSIGSERKERSEGEKENLKVVRKSIVARRSIKEGQVITERDICTKRPGTGVSAARWDEIIGSRATRSFKEDELIKL